uniref:Uncharacterized protein n=1 Tax=Glossina austeni TaxID=7395 RepID=A0A1A9VQG0_GLOAU
MLHVCDIYEIIIKILGEDDPTCTTLKVILVGLTIKEASVLTNEILTTSANVDCVAGTLPVTFLVMLSSLRPAQLNTSFHIATCFFILSKQLIKWATNSAKIFQAFDFSTSSPLSLNPIFNLASARSYLYSTVLTLFLSTVV